LTEEERFSQFATAALRGPKKGTFEQLLCQHLILAVTAKPLKKISLICEAAMMAAGSEKDIDFELVQILHKLATSFQQAIHNRWYNARFCSINWSFATTEENFGKYIMPWLEGGRLRYYPFLGSTMWKEEAEAIRREVDEWLASLPYWQYFFTVTTQVQLTEESYRRLLGQFTGWALPQAMKMFAELSRLVQPQLYREMLTLLAGKPSEAGVENEGSMGSR